MSDAIKAMKDEVNQMAFAVGKAVAATEDDGPHWTIRGTSWTIDTDEGKGRVDCTNPDDPFACDFQASVLRPWRPVKDLGRFLAAEDAKRACDIELGLCEPTPKAGPKLPTAERLIMFKAACACADSRESKGSFDLSDVKVSDFVSLGNFPAYNDEFVVTVSDVRKARRKGSTYTLSCTVEWEDTHFYEDEY